MNYKAGFCFFVFFRGDPEIISVKAVFGGGVRVSEDVPLIVWKVEAESGFSLQKAVMGSVLISNR